MKTINAEKRIPITDVEGDTANVDDGRLEVVASPVGADGNLITDEIVETVLERILKELKIMNLHLSMITDNFITNQEIE